METKVVDNPDAMRFEVYADDELAGFAEYRKRGQARAFTHTEIDKRFGGQGLGSVLARGALDTTREQGLSVLPHCPFIRGWIAKHPDYVDLVPEDERERFDL